MTDPNTFTGAALDRAGDGRRRDPGWVAAQRSHPGARAVVAGRAGVRAADGRLVLEPLEAAAASLDGEVLLGLDAAGPVFAVDEDPLPELGAAPELVAAAGRRGQPPPDAPGHLGLREAGSILPQAEGGLAAYAAAVLNWHRGHRFCANCGAESKPDEGGLVRRCPACGAEHHPRTDPVVIMLVTDGCERVLLGRQRSWPEGRYSALAGFVGPGESLEEAVAREVEEEAGVAVGAPAYLSSQPWPFPASLMVGFIAQWRGGEPGGADAELQDVRWFDRDRVAAAAREDYDSWQPRDPGAGLALPPRLAIARRLLEHWLADGPQLTAGSSQVM